MITLHSSSKMYINLTVAVMKVKQEKRFAALTLQHLKSLESNKILAAQQ
jgi:hypothetical protein